jgi:hypothetical protein
VKKVRTKTGDIFQIPIDDNSICFGQVVENRGGVLRIVTFDTLHKPDDLLNAQKIFSSKIVLLTNTMDAKIYYGDWKVYANSSLVEVNLPRPHFKLGLDPTYVTDYEGKRIRIATKEEENLFDYKFSVAPIRIQNAMQAFFKKKAWEPDFEKMTYDYCLEKSKLSI